MKKHGPVKKEPIDPGRIRRLPREGFSWIDRRFVREGLIDQLSPEASLLYFFLVAVSDAQGLSFYADPTISKTLGLDREELSRARAALRDADLILYQYPLWQVLPLPPKEEKPSGSAFSSGARNERGGDPMSLGEILKVAIESAGREKEPAPRETKIKERHEKKI
jgi:hypothetical protein